MGLGQLETIPVPNVVMPGLVPGICVAEKKNADGGDLLREDALRAFVRP